MDTTADANDDAHCPLAFPSRLITIIACMIVSFGATQLKDNLLYEMYDGARENLSAAIVVGALLIVVGCIGCFGAFTSHRSGVLCFFIFCVAVLVGQLFVITFFYARMHEDSVQLEQSAFKVKWIEFAKDARQKGSDDAAVEEPVGTDATASNQGSSKVDGAGRKPVSPEAREYAAKAMTSLTLEPSNPAAAKIRAHSALELKLSKGRLA